MNNKRDKNGKFCNNAIYVQKECLKCGCNFLIKESSLKHNKGKYCSRKCCDLHKKEICVGKGNGRYGKNWNEEQRKKISNRFSLLWENDKFRQKIKDSKNKFVEKNGYWPGSDSKSKEKRRNTMLEKYGVTHNWASAELRKKCDETCKLLYGKTSIELMMDALKNQKETNIEKKVKQLLIKYNIKYEQYYSIPCGNSYKEYDFYLPDKNILLEIDGDFWHANPKYYDKTELLEVQQKNIENDVVKNKLAESYCKRLIRFWESDILDNNFEKILLESINYETV